MLGLEACQTYIYSGSACTKPKDVRSGNLVNPYLCWAQGIAEPEDVGFDSSPYPNVFGLSA